MKRSLRHGSLFSGIGGFDLAAQKCGIENVFQVEYNEWCRKVLKKNFPDATQYQDIYDFDGKKYRGKIEILSGGFPCQPFSVSGKRKGKNDNRYLWPQMLRVIREIKPPFLICENVTGIIHLALSTVLADLEAEGYKTETFIIPACAKGALHRRERVWVIAYTIGKSVRLALAGSGRRQRKETENLEHDFLQLKKRKSHSAKSSLVREVLSHTLPEGVQVSSQWIGKEQKSFWSAKPGVGRVADGIPKGLDRIKGLGNAIVPQIAEEFFRCIISVNNKLKGKLSGVEKKKMSKKILPENHEEYLQLVTEDLRAGTTRNKLYYESKARDLKILDKNLVKELTELAITNRAREIAHEEKTYHQRFVEIVELYKKQVNLSHRTSQSMLLQQYSTPAPISFLAGIFTGADLYGSTFEPCAGNGLLCIASRADRTVVNEIDPVRIRHLRTQGFVRVLTQDATKRFENFEKRYSCVLANPPFGKMDKATMFGKYGITTLEHMMALNALECMADDGNAAIIVGGHTHFDSEGRITKGANRIFLDYLYHHYNVVDVIPIDGKSLYSRQGTGMDTRLILISRRKRKPEGHPPLFSREREIPVTDFDTLYDRVMNDRRHIMPMVYNTFEDWLALKREEDENVNEKEIEDAYVRTIIGMTKMGFDFPYDVTISYKKLVGDEVNKIDVDELERQADALYRNFEELSEEEKEEKMKPIQSNSEKPNGFRITFKEISKPHTRFLAYKSFFSEQDAKRWAESETDHFFKKVAGKKVEVENITPIESPEFLNGLGAPYLPSSEGCVVLDTVVPDAMDYETHSALKQVKAAVGGDIDEFVRNRLGYPSKIEMCKALAAEQIDAVALAIYNIEAREQGMIDGDQTGIGKGRVAAALIRYGVKQGYNPIFLTEKPNLFSDLYRDLRAIGSGRLVPLIINAKENKTDILDENGDVIHEALAQHEQKNIFENRKMPKDYHFVLGTYSQFNSKEVSAKQVFLLELAKKNIVILDEAHNASGDGNTGAYFQNLLSVTKGVLFLSATFAKRPANMPLYAAKTLMRETNMTRTELVHAIKSGGVALQEVLASELVKEGQMLRRERSYEGVEVNYVMLDEMEDEHRAISDTVTEIIRDIIAFQKSYVTIQVKFLDKELADQQKQVEIRKGTKEAGVSNEPYFSRVFNVITQMLFSIKAEAVADRAIMRLKEGKKPVIAFASTMGSFIESMDNEKGEPVGDGDIIAADFAEVLKRGLHSVMQYTIVHPDGSISKQAFSVNELGPKAQFFYSQIVEKIESVSTGISVSPIDVIIRRIEKAGYTVAEVTGRKYGVELNDYNPDKGVKASSKKSEALTEEDIDIDFDQFFVKTVKIMGRVYTRKKIVTNEAFRKFNNNEIDVLLINQSGSTGASAHAIVTDKVPADQVKQRVMIVLQPELDINTEVQKRGRINRTGQLFKPIYDYVTSAIPAEKRLMMMLQKKLKSLDANTSSNQKQSAKILDVPDFLNKYGDLVVAEYLVEHPLISDLLNLEIEKDEDKDTKTTAKDDMAHQVSGRVAVLSTNMQQDFYDEVAKRYSDYVEYMKQTGEYDLEVEEMKLDAKTLHEQIIIMGRGGRSSFGKDSVLETAEVNVLRKPMKPDELELMMHQSLEGHSPQAQQNLLRDEYLKASVRMFDEEIEINKTNYAQAIEDLKNSPRMKKILAEQGWDAYAAAMDEEERQAKEESTAKELRAMRNYERRKDFSQSIIDFFYTGRLLNYPVNTLEEGQLNIPTVFIGFAIDRNQKNPFVPSAIKLRFALAGGMRYFVIPASKIEIISRIKGESFDLEQHPLERMPEIWAKLIKNRTNNRSSRFIITGNILQALGTYRTGKLINYTTNDGAVKKGILMPEYWHPKSQGREEIIIPASKALPILQSLGEGSQIAIGKFMSLFRRDGRFMLIVTRSRTNGGNVFLNENILKLMNGNNFNSQSDKMLAYFEPDKLEAVLEILEKEIGTTVAVTAMQFELIKKRYPQLFKEESFPKLKMLPEVVEDEQSRERELELEAEALLLLLELEEDD
jgi:DNA-cytosine methyltransferase